MSKAPSERELLRVERELKQASRATSAPSAAASTCASTAPTAAALSCAPAELTARPGGTYGTWQEAYNANSSREATLACVDENSEPRAAEMREWEVALYAVRAWWPRVELECDALTEIDYRRGLKDLLPHVRGVTLAQIDSSPLLMMTKRTPSRRMCSY